MENEQQPEYTREDFETARKELRALAAAVADRVIDPHQLQTDDIYVAYKRGRNLEKRSPLASQAIETTALALQRHLRGTKPTQFAFVHAAVHVVDTLETLLLGVTP